MEQLHLQPRGHPGRQRGARQSGQDGGRRCFLVYIPVAHMGEERRGRCGQEIEQIDPLGQVLRDTGHRGEIEEQKGPPAHAEARENAGQPAHQHRAPPGYHPSSAFPPP